MRGHEFPSPIDAAQMLDSTHEGSQGSVESMSGSEHLVQMANDIGNFFRAQSNHEAAVAGVANHIKSFWTPRMLQKLLAQIEQGEAGLDPLPRAALCRLSAQPDAKPRQQPGGGDAG